MFTKAYIDEKINKSFKKIQERRAEKKEDNNDVHLFLLEAFRKIVESEEGFYEIKISEKEKVNRMQKAVSSFKYPIDTSKGRLEIEDGPVLIYRAENSFKLRVKGNWCREKEYKDYILKRIDDHIKEIKFSG